LIEPLMLAHSNLISQVIKYDDQLKTMARSNQTVRRLMTVPGVGPVTALAFASTVDDPQRFERASDVGAYLGLTPRRYQSGELDRTGRISKRGDRLTRYYLFEAANVLLRVVRRGSPLKSWGLKLAKRSGQKRRRSQSLASSPPSCIVSGPTARSSTGERRQHDPLINPLPPSADRIVPAGTMVSVTSKFVPAAPEQIRSGYRALHNEASHR
jgi:hypothetical protein